MGTFVALVLVATLLLPLASVGAQEEVDPGAPPVTTEETLPPTGPPPAVEEPPIPEVQPEIPVVEEPVGQEPMSDEPAVDEPIVEIAGESSADPVAQGTGTDAVLDETGSDPEAVDGETTEDEEPDAAEGTPSVISGLTVDCTGLVSFSFVEWHGEELGVSVGTTDPNANTGWGGELNSIVYMNSSGNDFSGRIAFDGDPADIFATVRSIASGEPIGQSATVICHEELDPETDTEHDGNEEPVDSQEEQNAAATVISSASLDCDGTLTFTIAEAGNETLHIQFTNLHAPNLNQDMGSVSFPVTGTGAFQVSIGVGEWVDVFQADISSALASGVIGQAAAYGCITGEEQALGYGISNMSVTCTGAITFTVGAVEGGVSIRLFDGSTNPRTLLGSAGIGYIIDGGGEQRTIDFALPEGQFDSLVADAWSHNDWAPLAIAYAHDCVDDEEPEPEPTETTVTNLRLFCNGMVRFELGTVDPVTLDFVLTATGVTPEYARNQQVTLGNGSQQVLFGIPVTWFDDWDVTLSQSGEVLAQTSVTGCLTTDPNDVTGDEIMVTTVYGSVLFDRVTVGGETIIDRFSSPNPPALPDGYETDSARYFDVSTTVTHEGGIEVCLSLSAELSVDLDEVRMLQYVDDAWVELDTAFPNGAARACAFTSSLSTFALARGADVPDPTLPVVENLTVDCAGLVTFDLETSESVTLDVSIFIPAAAPGYRDETQITADSGSQRVQFDLPVHPYEWAVGISLGTELLADAVVQGCPMQPLNTLPGSDVTVPVAGGTVTFENVLESGETTVTPLDPEAAPPLPAQYAGQLVIMVDISTTAVIDGVAEVCLPVAEDAGSVRLLHFENGAWVDITTSAGNGQVCGVTSSFSPFAVVKLSGQEPEGPSGPNMPDPQEPEAGWHVSGSHHGDSNATGGVSLTSLPNTGAGPDAGDNGARTVQLLLCVLALLAAATMRPSRIRGTRSH
jgi:hypothetical protein